MRATDMRVAIFGAGGLGAYFGGRLASAGLDISLDGSIGLSPRGVMT